MAWEPVHGYEHGMNLDDRPRRLTQQEVDYIVSHLPPPPAADIESAQLARDGVVECLRQSLSEIEICPTAVPILIHKIVEQHRKSLIEPGTPVGITAAEAVGSTSTQMTLNTFHSSGSAKSVSFGIDSMRSIIYARKNPKNPTSTIYYNNKSASYEEILDSRQYIVGSLVSDFVSDYDIDSPTVLEQYWWHQTVEQLRPAKVLRLFLNITEMYRHRVSIGQLARVLEKEVPPSIIAVHGPIGDGIIDLYPDPKLIAQTLTEQKITTIDPELAALTYLETIVIPEFENIRVKGVAGIRKLYPVISPVWKMVMLERKVKELDITNDKNRQLLGPLLGTAWYLFTNSAIMKSSGLEHENLAALCQNAGLELVAQVPKTGIIINMPSDRWRTDQDEVVIFLDGSYYRIITEVIIDGPNVYKQTQEETGDDIRYIDGQPFILLSPDIYIIQDGLVYEAIDPETVPITELSPSKYVRYKIEQDKNWIQEETARLVQLRTEEARDKTEEERRRILRRPIEVERTDLLRSSEYVIADTDGSNLKDLLALPGVDKTRTTCNNMYTIAETLGIEATRTFLVRSLKEIISNAGSYVHPANITFIAEFITSRGAPYGATYTGISRQPGGHLSLATVERAGKVFTQNALFGRKEDIRNVSASVVVGARTTVGSGSVGVAQDIVEDGVEQTIMNADLFTGWKRDDQIQEEMERQTGPTMDEEHLQTGLDLLKALNSGGGFDFMGENESDLRNVFKPEFFPTGKPTETRPDLQPVRRVPARPITQQTITDPVAPDALVDALALMKTGIPTEQTDPEEDPRPQPITSTGLIPLEEFVSPDNRQIAATEVDQLLTMYEQMAQATDLPRADIPTLPDMTGVNQGRYQMETREAEIRNLEPVVPTNQ